MREHSPADFASICSMIGKWQGSMKFADGSSNNAGATSVLTDDSGATTTAATDGLDTATDTPTATTDTSAPLTTS